VIKTLKH